MQSILLMKLLHINTNVVYEGCLISHGIGDHSDGACDALCYGTANYSGIICKCKKQMSGNCTEEMLNESKK